MSVGTVVKIGGKNTATVRVERMWMHPIYKKRVKNYSKFLAHDLIGVVVGDKVKIAESKPISKRKRHVIEEKL